jgi:hypothetical protein
MLKFLRYSLLLAVALPGLSACQKAAADDFENGPVTVLGEWRLAVVGGGITGKMDPVPAGSETRLVFGPDSTYAQYQNGKLQETNCFQLRSQPRRGGAIGTERVLILKTTNTYGGQPQYYPYYVAALTATALNFGTGTGCGISYEYVRVKATSPLPAAGGN